MPMPSINIIFKTLAATAISRSQKGVVAVIVRDSVLPGLHAITQALDIPPELSADNRAYLARTFVGYVTPPRKVVFYVIAPEAADLTDALKALALEPFDYLVGPPDLTGAEAQAVAGWVKSERLAGHTVKAVLPNLAADNEAIVNLTADGMEAGDDLFLTGAYCSRIAGLIAGTPMTMSATYAPLLELSNVERLTPEALDKAVDAGELVLFWDGVKVKTGRAVNSLVTTTQDKGDSFKKIKIVEVLDMIQNDVKSTAQDSYIGKYANSYDNKCLLIVAIKGYLEGLEAEEILAAGTSQIGIDVAAQERYLKGQGIDPSTMNKQQIKEANTGSKVFLAGTISILDAIEDIDLNIAL